MIGRAMKYVVAAAVLLAAWLTPKLALACPFCAGKEDSGVSRVVGLGVMIVLPFLVVGFAVWALRGAIPPKEGVDQ